MSMKILLIWLAFISLIVGRWWLGPKEQLAAGERVKLTVPTVDFPEYVDGGTILRRGKWEVRIKDYVEWEPGEVVEVSGEWDGRKIDSDTATKCHDCGSPNWSDKMLIGVSYVRRWAVSRFEQVLPEPEASLAIGILLGVRRRMSQEFYQSLANTGTMHIIAASGYNVAVVGGALMAIAVRLVGRTGGVGVGVVGIWLYVLLAGGSASVVRAGIMGSLTLMAYYWGRPTEAKRLLWVAAGVMLLINPLYIVDIGFQLSIAATAGLLYFSPKVDGWLREYLYPTLAASVATAPIIWYHFGRLAWITPVANMLVLPLVPLTMLLSVMTLALSPAAYLLYVPLWGIVTMIEWLG